MKSFWVIPIYVIIPFIGIILTIIGFIKFKKEKGKGFIFSGLLLLIVPFIHLFFVFLQNNNLENKLVGKYNYGNLNSVLEIKDDGEFELKSGKLYTLSGKGTWKTENIDFPILILDFQGNNNAEWLEIKTENDKIFLSNIGSDTTFTIEFEKN